MEKLQNRDHEQTVNAESFGVIKSYRIAQKDGTEHLVLDFCAEGQNEHLFWIIGDVKSGVSFVEQTKKAKNLNAYRIFAEMKGLDARKLTDAQAIEAIARFAVDWGLANSYREGGSGSVA